MKTQEKNTKEKSLTQKMLDDKKAVRDYIKKNGTLKEFENDGIKFAKPF